MHGRSGAQLPAQLQAARPDIGVLFMSGYTTRPIIADATSDRRVHFVPRLFRRDDLVARVRERCAMPLKEFPAAAVASVSPRRRYALPRDGQETDAADRCFRRGDRERLLALLLKLRDPQSPGVVIRDLTDLLDEWTGCEAVAVALAQMARAALLEDRVNQIRALLLEGGHLPHETPGRSAPTASDGGI
jgi:hypothetical protein